MIEHQYPVSDVVASGTKYTLIDQPYNEDWRYSWASAERINGEPIPTDGNTVVFRIRPGGMTEPMVMTSAEPSASFTIKVCQGDGLLIRTQCQAPEDEKPPQIVEQIAITKNSDFVIRPGNVYAYINTGSKELILRDTAVPAFSEGDEHNLAEAIPIAEAARHPVLASVPEAFYNAVGRLMRQIEPQQENTL